MRFGVRHREFEIGKLHSAERVVINGPGEDEGIGPVAADELIPVRRKQYIVAGRAGYGGRRHDKLPRELPEYVSTARSFFKQEASHTKTYKASLTITANPYL